MMGPKVKFWATALKISGRDPLNAQYRHVKSVGVNALAHMHRLVVQNLISSFSDVTSRVDTNKIWVTSSVQPSIGSKILR